MTVRINFLPKSYQPPKQMGAKEWGIIAATALVVVGTGAYYSSVYSGTVAMASQAEASQVKLKQVQAQLAHATEIKTREVNVVRAEQDLKSLAGRQWSSVLLTLSQLTPKHVSWTSLKASGDEITLKGTSRGLVDMAQLLGGLVTESTVQQVTLKFINEKGIPISVVVKQGDKTDGTSGLAEQMKDVGEVKTMEFELVVTLVPAEGRKSPYGT
jgi:Tfp pilus assembly protein PilN